MWDQFVRSTVEILLTAVAQGGVKKFSELSGQKDKEVAAATRVADEFMSALKKGAQGSAGSRCTPSLRAELTKRGLSQLFPNIDLRGVSWTWDGVDDSSEDNRWGWSELTIRGSLVNAKVKGQPDSVGWPLEVTVVKEEGKWQVLKFSPVFPL